MFNEVYQEHAVTQFSAVIRPAVVAEGVYRYTCQDNAHDGQYECGSQNECRYWIVSFLVCTVIMKHNANEHDERRHREDTKQVNNGRGTFCRCTVTEVKRCNRCLRECFKPNFRETKPEISRDTRLVQAVIICAIVIDSQFSN